MLESSNRWIKILIVIILLFDLGYSFVQHYYEPLDGDMVGVILPTTDYAPVLQDPFGLSILLEGKKYAATNRYFVHQSVVSWFRYVPFVFQQFTDPVNSVYASAALFKIILQVFLLWFTGCLHYRFL